MGNGQLYLVIGLPTVSVLVGILINLVQITGIRGDINSLRGDMQNNTVSLRSEVSMLTGKVIELIDRVLRLEARNER